MGYAEKKAEVDFQFRRMVESQRLRRFPFELSHAITALQGELDAARREGLIATNSEFIRQHREIFDTVRRKRNAIVHEGEWGLRLGKTITTRLPRPYWPKGQRRSAFMSFLEPRPTSIWTNHVTGAQRFASLRIDPLWTFDEAPQVNVIQLLGQFRDLLRKGIQAGTKGSGTRD